jgi:hypothetical protein
MNGDDEKMIKELFAPMDAKLEEFRREYFSVPSDIAVIKNEQVHQGDYIEALQGDVRGLRDRVDTMPDTWRTDIKSSIDDHKKQDEEITAVTNLAKERADTKRDRGASLIPAATKKLFVRLLPFILYGLALLGAYTMTRLGSPDAEDVTNAVKAIQRVEAKIVEMEKGEGAEEER